METVSLDLIGRIRLHINRTEKQALLLKKQKEWIKLTAALDVLEDSSFAVDYYVCSDYPSEVPGKYLFIYGLLQALFLQQDAVKGICDALLCRTINYSEDYPAASAIRELRNDVAGHPIDRSGRRYVYLVQLSLSKKSFEYIIEDPDNNASEFVSVDVNGAISDTAKAVNAIMQDALDELDTEFKDYIDAHRGRKMKAIFDQLNYAMEKALLNTHMKSWGYNATKKMVAKCEAELIQRYGSPEVVDSYKYLLDKIHKIYYLVDDGLPRIPDDLRNDISECLHENLFAKLEKLASYCAETDDYFDNYGQSPFANS